MKIKLLGAILLLLASPALGSVAEWKPFEEKVRDADGIVHGTVVATETRRDPSGRWLLTYTTLDVKESLKGQNGSRITLVTPGGSENGLHQRTIGVPEFRPGDERIIFTKNASIGTAVLYQDQGTYEVVRERGAARVVPASSDLILYDPQTGVVRPAESAIPIGQFTIAVQDARRRFERDPLRADTGPRGDGGSGGLDVLEDRWIIVLLLVGVVLAMIPLYRKFR